MGLFGKKKQKLITCNEENYLVWKWRPTRKSKGDIVVGTKIQIKEGAVAVFVYKNEIGTYLDFLTGPSDEPLAAENLPIIASIMGKDFKNQAPLRVEVYFINLMKTIQSNFEVPEFEVRDPSAPDIGVPVTVKGILTYRITSAAEFVKRHRLDEVTEEGLMKQVTDSAVKYLKSAFVNAPSIDNLPVTELERRINEINELVEIPIRERLAEDLGVKVTSVDIETIDIDEESEGYKKLVGTKPSGEENPVVTNESAAAQNPATMTEPATASENNPSGQAQVAEVKFYVAVGGKPVGPYKTETLRKMLAEATITRDNLVWHQGMKEWTKIADTDELKNI